MKLFDPTEPIYVGFCGPAGSGKTETAKIIVPPTSARLTESDSNQNDPILWDHLYFAMPLYEMASIKTTIRGTNSEDRILYALHDVLDELMRDRIPFSHLIKLISDINKMHINTDDAKPRSFLQNAGDLCLAEYPNCFADFIKYKVQTNYRKMVAEYERDGLEVPWFITIASDLRMPHEADMVKAQTNNILIKFIASKKVLKERLLDRDGDLLTPTQAKHRTENSFDMIPDDMFDLILDTDGMTLEEQCHTVYTYIKNIQLSEVSI